MYHDTFVVFLLVCSFAFHVGFISCLLCCTNHVKGTENIKSHILSKNDELCSCSVQNMIRKHLLEIDTVQIPQSPTKNIVYRSENTSFNLKNQVNLH